MLILFQNYHVLCHKVSLLAVERLLLVLKVVLSDTSWWWVNAWVRILGYDVALGAATVLLRWFWVVAALVLAHVLDMAHCHMLWLWMLLVLFHRVSLPVKIYLKSCLILNKLRLTQSILTWWVFQIWTSDCGMSTCPCSLKVACGWSWIIFAIDPLQVFWLTLNSRSLLNIFLIVPIHLISVPHTLRATCQVIDFRLA